METRQLLGGRYELVRRIGAGGMAVVYLAHDTRLDRDVAIKVLDTAGARDQTFVERFRREARAAASINNPHVVAIFDWGEVPPTEVGGEHVYYLVMEYVPGPNLKEVIERNGQLPETEALRIAEQVAEGLEAAHVRGLVHRDVKSQNILIDPGGRAKVVDFGIAYLEGVTHLTQTNAVTGSAHYISPEQASGRPLDRRSDLYSLGVVLYEMLTGRVPFDGGALVDVALRHLNEIPASPRAIRPDLSVATETIVMRALSKEPAMRYASAAEMQAALERARLGLLRQPNASPETASQLVVAERVPRARPSSRREPADRSPRAERRFASFPSAARTERHGPRLHRWAMAAPFLVIVLIAAALAWKAHGTHTALKPPAAATVGRGTARHHRARIVRGTPVARPTARPKPTAPVPTPTVSSPSPTSPPAVISTPPAVAGPGVAVGSAATGTLGSSVLSFYRLVSQHSFAAAATLWSPAMQARYPPGLYIDQRFAETRQITAQISSVVIQGSDARVGVDVTELTLAGGTQSFAGSWYLVHGPGGWLLDRVALSPVSAGLSVGVSEIRPILSCRRAHGGRCGHRGRHRHEG